MSSVLIMAGGTGGHVYPGLAVARELQAQGIEVVWLGTRKGLEARVIPEAGIEVEYISISGLKGRGILQWMLAPFRVLVALVQALRILRRRHPTLVLSMGGFVAGPGGLVAWLLGRPLVIHEQNAIPGFTNRILSMFARRILTGFPGVFSRFPKTLHSGNPVREGIRSMPDPEQRLHSHKGPMRILVIGGSQGARRLNQAVADVMHLWRDESAPEIWHQCGERLLQETRDRYGKRILDKGHIRLVPFIEQMEQAYDWADLVICRAGAMTISELACAGMASILVPFPYATDDHQTANANYLVERDAAVLIPEDQLSVERLHEVLHELDQNREVIEQMSIHARASAMPDATDTICEICHEVMYA
ncbi:MAG: undecaprenyldiphospho-muramoylpentapeptide beta-N-acetylglucosaminyltransferase [Acidiferrobacterales bacterium]|jgi:UDP-N-acetylglucosamine--N-acetylmuramyl-(pentapeptide) pyrophosphoryl-undecaprenol N-acetylglucosamine transferase|nr:undecaprenyldiphospho-muramoylpentapeptide beta-N-acetylglucosaminyltransferase [Acidiferrobacterales bacterium]